MSRITKEHHDRIGRRLQLLLDYLSHRQVAVVEQLVEMVWDEAFAEGLSQGRDIGWEERKDFEVEENP